MKAFYITILFLVSFLSTGKACSCAYVPTFCETITFGGHISSAYLIVHGIVEDKDGSYMTVRIKDVLFGNPQLVNIAIPDGNGADCRESISTFTIGKDYIFAVYDHGEFGYSLSICGVTWLEVENNVAKGPIAPGVTSLAIQDFHQLQDCGDIDVISTSISVNPTLTSDVIEVETNAENLLVEIVMYDMLGRMVYSRPAYHLMATEPLVIAADQLPSGCYTIVTEAVGIRQVFRVVIVT